MFRSLGKNKYEVNVLVSLGLLVALSLSLAFATNWTLLQLSRSLKSDSQDELIGALMRSGRILERSPDLDTGLRNLRRAENQRGKTSFAIMEEDEEFRTWSSVSKDSAYLSPPLDAYLAKLSTDGELASAPFTYTYIDDTPWEIAHTTLRVNRSAYVLIVARYNQNLLWLNSSTDRSLALGILAIALVAFSTVVFFRKVTRPISHLQSSAATVGIHGENPEDTMDEIVSAYKDTIERLSQKESDLIELNKILRGKVGDIEKVNKLLINSMSTGVVILDCDGALVGINEQACGLLALGVRSGELVSGEKKEDYVGLFEFQPDLKRLVEESLIDGVSNRLEVDVANTESDDITIGCTVIHLEEDGVGRGVVILVSDQTELARERKQLEASRQLTTMGEMAAGLAHQLRNSISAALGFGELVRKLTDAESVARRNSDSLIQELKEQAALVDRFLNFAQPLALNTRTFDLREFLEEIVESYQVKESQRGRVVVSTVSKGKIEADHLLLKQVVKNLIDNALAACESIQGKVEIWANIGAEEFLIRIIDDGPGISPEDTDKIFTPFYSSSPSGFGLGLPLARRIVNLHGGTLNFEPNPDAGGAVFCIQAPTKAQSETGAIETISSHLAN
ncbi:MAG: hypothetical protein IIB00_05465 [candidate division Zixibacteria bacterium]|nr:hypothetical protein [candidate division Zixibacteria bacterium]